MFPRLMRSLNSEFHHTVGMLLAAAYLSDAGNGIGFTNVRAEAGRSPDLFLNISPTDRASVEIKAPSSLQWPEQIVPNTSRLEKIIETQVKNAKDQLGVHGGVVVIATSLFHQDVKQSMASAIDSLIIRRRISSKIVGIAAVCQSPAAFNLEPNTLNMQAQTEVWVTKNPKYSGVIELKGAKWN